MLLSVTQMHPWHANDVGFVRTDFVQDVPGACQKNMNAMPGEEVSLFTVPEMKSKMLPLGFKAQFVPNVNSHHSASPYCRCSRRPKQGGKVNLRLSGENGKPERFGRSVIILNKYLHTEKVNTQVSA